jgi:hypothetical protein
VGSFSSNHIETSQNLKVYIRMTNRAIPSVIGGLLLTLTGAAYPVQRGSAVIQWNSATLQAIRDSKLGAPMAARALAIVHTCMYDAWAAYDDHAVGTQLSGGLRRPPPNER